MKVSALNNALVTQRHSPPMLEGFNPLLPSSWRMTCSAAGALGTLLTEGGDRREADCFEGLGQGLGLGLKPRPAHSMGGLHGAMDVQ